MAQKAVEHAFSIELNSKDQIKSVKLGDDSNGQVFIEGYLGELSELNLVERSMLEVKGVNGILRLDISEMELKKLLDKGLL